MYTPIPFPKWKYSKTKRAVIVQDPDEERALGPGWQDAPFVPEPAKPTPGKPKTENK